MSSEPQPAPELSFGVELEGVFIFHQDLLKTVLTTGQTIQRNGLNDKGQPLPETLYPSGWAIRYKEGEEIKFTKYQNQAIDMAKGLIAAAQNAEPEAAKLEKKLDASDGSDDSDCSMEMSEGDEGEKIEQDNEAETNDQQPWEVVRDTSISQLTRNQKAALGLDPEQWDSSDIEFVSKKYVYGNGVGVETLQNETQKLTSTLKVEDKSSLDVTNDCNMHVHIGLNNDSQFTLKVLRNLAFVSLIFEPEIARLHPPHCAPGKPGSHAQSNFIPFVVRWDSGTRHWTDAPEFFDEDCGPEWATRKWRTKYGSIQGIRQAIFSTVHGDGDDGYRYLKNLISPDDSKKWVVNFQNIDGKNIVYDRGPGNRPTNKSITRPPTVEFRQFAATFDSVVAGHRVHLCAAIVRLAIRLAEAGEEVFPEVTNWETMPKLEDLFAKLNSLPVDTREYFQILAQRRGPVSEDDNVALFWEVM